MLLTDDYENLIIEINHAVLALAYRDFDLLNEDQKSQLARAHCARVLFPDMPRLMTALPDPITDLEQYGHINHQMDALMRAFERQLATDEDMTEIHNHMAREKLPIQAQAKQNATHKLFHRYVPDAALETRPIRAEEYHQLTLFIAAILQANASNEMALSAFNQEQAEDIADQVLTAFENEEDLPMDHWLTAYEQSLRAHMTERLGTIAGNNNAFQPASSTQENTLDLLSSIYTNNVSAETREAFFTALDEMADAHAFIQATGFSTQNETSYLSWVDVYNYTRSRQYIKDAKNDLYRFFNPFMPLFAEWRNISQYETNMARQIMRTLIPILILVGVVILVAALLSPIVISEAAAILILIPTLYVGALMATAYVLTKDTLYHQSRQWYYGGAYAIPEYQVNARMKAGFSTLEKAHQVRDFYIEEIKQCRAIEADFQHRLAGTLTDSDMVRRQKNAERYDTLNLEWYDIHSNSLVGNNRIKDIALKRIQQDGRAACEQSAIKDAAGVRTWAHDVVTGIQATLHHVHEVGVDAPITRPNHNRFFIPACIEQQAKAERLNALQEAIHTSTISIPTQV